MRNNFLALYVHWPFCKSKCPYCDFNSHVRDAVDYKAWMKAYLTELRHFAPQLKDKQLTSIFFGGGTPSLMPPSIAAEIIDDASRLFSVSGMLEITLEANPTSVELGKFKDFKKAGVNRVSLGIQSLIAEDLHFLGRTHNVEEAQAAIEMAANVFDRYSFDLIYARPKQTTLSWENELQRALKLADGHLSLYQLTIEKGTAFYGSHLKGDFVLPDDEAAAELYEVTHQIMENAGLPAYEISNHAAPGQECRHNLSYWHYDDYLGIGPGAHSRINREALMMIHLPENWLQSVEAKGQGLQQRQRLAEREILEEMLLMGLRLNEGVSRERFHHHAGGSPEEVLPANRLTMLSDNGLLILDKDGLRATKAGLPVLNSIIYQLLAA